MRTAGANRLGVLTAYEAIAVTVRSAFLRCRHHARRVVPGAGVRDSRARAIQPSSLSDVDARGSEGTAQLILDVHPDDLIEGALGGEA